MNKSALYILLLAAALSSGFFACEEFDDNYSTNPNHRISFSTDTLAFDTIFTTIGSTTRKFLIYNKNNEPLNIEHITLAGSGATGFRMNVDGKKGNSFDNVGILANDSMYVFVEVTVDPNGANQPLLIQDSILFRINGIGQYVLLEAYGQDVHLYKGGVTFPKDTLLSADKPYLVYDSLVFAPQTTVSIEKGATFYFHNNANLIVHGSMKAAGTLDSPVVFRGDRLDHIQYNLSYDRTPAQWGGIFFQSGSYENELDHVIVRNGVTGMTFLPSDPERMKLRMNNSQVTNMDGNLFTSINCRMEIANSEFSNTSGMAVGLFGGNYDFNHCTMANFITLKRRNDTIPQTLVVSNALPGKQTGKVSAVFNNCIIDGSLSARDKDAPGEILADSLSGDVYYKFNHCVLKYRGEDNENFTGNKYIDKSLAYRKLGGMDNAFEYDFRLDADTTAGVGMADPDITALYPVDRYGVSRLDSPHAPTAGAYEFVPKPEEEEE